LTIIALSVFKVNSEDSFKRHPVLDLKVK